MYTQLDNLTTAPMACLTRMDGRLAGRELTAKTGTLLLVSFDSLFPPVKSRGDADTSPSDPMCRRDRQESSVLLI